MIAVLLALLSGCRREPDDPPAGWVPEELGRCAAFDPNRVALFGDTHVHTRLSLDASLQGNRLSPADAYRFARGEAVGIQPHDAAGNALRTIRLARPLDWVALSDHAEFLGVVTVCTTPGLDGYDSEDCVRYRDLPDASFVGLNALLALEPASAAPPGLCDAADCDAGERTAWDEIRAAAEAAYDRTEACRFTSFVGYEWSSNPGTYNLHRNVIFRNERVPDRPIGYFDEPWPEDLWAALDRACLDAGTGCDVLTIPHNSNLSGGRMFDPVDKAGAPIDAAYAEKRAAMEPLVEVFQHKGSSECWPGSPAGDELCGFEELPYDNLANAHLDVESTPTPQDFVRDALGAGLELEAELGANPYRYGLVASTDTHLGAPGSVAEVAFPGHGGAGQSNRDELPAGLTDLVAFNPGGLAVVWAEENSREGIFRAMLRKEVYGTSGPRITLRLFGGYGYEPAMCADNGFAGAGYAGGVPMGGTLGPGSGAPRFAISALRDPGAGEEPGTPLQRVQVVKGWLEGGAARYAVIDVAGDAAAGDGLDPGTCDPVAGGFDDLCTVWTDPDFDPSVPAFWYVRVLEVPSCRWSQRLCVAAGVDCAGPVDDAFAGCCDPEIPLTVQERAWSSPIWYAPGP